MKLSDIRHPEVYLRVSGMAPPMQEFMLGMLERRLPIIRQAINSSRCLGDGAEEATYTLMLEQKYKCGSIFREAVQWLLLEAGADQDTLNRAIDTVNNMTRKGLNPEVRERQ